MRSPIGNGSMQRNRHVHRQVVVHRLERHCQVSAERCAGLAMPQCRTGSDRCHSVSLSEGARTQLSLMVRPKPMSPNGEQVAHNVVDP
jgi:hypothetical protein